MKYAGLEGRPARVVQSAIIRNSADILPASVPAQVQSSKLFSVALKLAKAGLPIFFCAADKRPTCPHGFKDAICDLTALQTLWRKHPGPLVGVPTGFVSGIFVIDIDGAKHGSAEEWLERHAPYLPDTRHHRTQSGGLHLLFKHRGLSCSVSKLARGVDTRGDGGYIIWWPATLDADHYRAPLANLPEWMVEKLAPPPPTQSITTIERPECEGPPDTRLKGIIEAVVLARKGKRNQLTFWGACKIRSMLVKGELDAADGASAYAALIQASRNTGLSEREITRTIASALRAS
jgi:hypothetical protein